MQSPTAQAIETSVLECLKDGSWRSYAGKNLSALADWFKKTLATPHVRFCSSGTVGIEIALKSLHLRPGDEVILSAYDYPGNFRCIEELSARPVLCAPDHERGWCLTPEKMEQCVSPETKAIIVSHLHGQTAPMPAIMDWAKTRGLFVIEDACQAIGGYTLTSNRDQTRFKSKLVDAPNNTDQPAVSIPPPEQIPLGCWGDLGVFSFGGSKLVSAGRGGAVITQSDLLAQRMRHFCERGNDAFAMSEMQAAIVLPQCERLHEDHLLRLTSAKNLISMLQTYHWIEPVPLQSDVSQAFYKVGLRISNACRGVLHRDALVQQLRHLGVSAGEGFRGFASRSPKRFRSPHNLSNSNELALNTIVIHHDHLLDPQSGQTTTDRVVQAFRDMDQSMELDRER